MGKILLIISLLMVSHQAAAVSVSLFRKDGSLYATGRASSVAVQRGWSDQFSIEVGTEKNQEKIVYCDVSTNTQIVLGMTLKEAYSLVATGISNDTSTGGDSLGISCFDDSDTGVKSTVYGFDFSASRLTIGARDSKNPSRLDFFK